MATPQEPFDSDAVPKDDVRSYPATAADMQRYVDAQVALSRFKVPGLVHSYNPHEYLYVACFDGTGNDKNKDPLHKSNVGRIADLIGARFDRGDHQIAPGYVAGPGTEDSLWRRTPDALIGYTYDTRLEQMYDLFIRQAWQWNHADPNAQIRVAGVGFSRGAEQNAGLARLVEERGIQDPTGAIYTKNWHNEITHVEYTRPPLVPPHQVAQAVVLLDPVGTGAPEQRYDRRLPPSVISGLQLIAVDERRGLFKSDHIIDPGLTDDGRFLGLYVPGAHSDVGGGYLRDGLSIRSGNLAIDYLNGLSDAPFLERQPVPENPAMSVIHRSERGSLLYWLTPRVDRLGRYGSHTLEAAENSDWRHAVGDPWNAESVNRQLDQQFERQAIPVGAAPTASGLRTEATVRPNPLDELIDRLYVGATSDSRADMDHTARDYLETTLGQSWQLQLHDYARAAQQFSGTHELEQALLQ